MYYTPDTSTRQIYWLQVPSYILSYVSVILPGVSNKFDSAVDSLFRRGLTVVGP